MKKQKFRIFWHRIFENGEEIGLPPIESHMKDDVEEDNLIFDSDDIMIFPVKRLSQKVINELIDQDIKLQKYYALNEPKFKL